jgi:hypothetical protein
MLRKTLLFSSFSLLLVLGSFVTVASATDDGYPRPPRTTTQSPTTDMDRNPKPQSTTQPPTTDSERYPNPLSTILSIFWH